MSDRRTDEGLTGVPDANGGLVNPSEAQLQERMASGIAPILCVTSHDEGRNATVNLYGDRIERVKQAKRLSLLRSKEEVEVTPLRAVSSVQAKRDGIRYTKVTVFATGNPIEFRLAHSEAEAFRTELSRRIV